MNYLYFASAAPDGTTSTEEVIMISADKVSHYEMRNATDLRIFLNITSGKHKEVMKALAKAANNPLSFDGGFVTIADSENNSFCTPHITACASIAVVDAA